MSQRYQDTRIQPLTRTTAVRSGQLPGALAALLTLIAGTPTGMAQLQPAGGADRQAPAPTAFSDIADEDFGDEDFGLGQPERRPAANQPAGLRNPLGGSSPAPGGEGVKVDEHFIVDLHVHEEDLSNVLQMLSIQSQKNIVTSKNVSATVTANLYGVTFYEALDAILHVNGYGYIERGNFLYVYTLDELKEIEKAQRVRVWGIINLNYLNAIDAAEFVKPLLSEGGQIKTPGATKQFQIGSDGPVGADDYANDATMLVFDYPENLEEIKRVVAELDTRPSQVLISATILQTALDEANAFGVDFSVLGDVDFGDFMNAPLNAVDRLIGGGGVRDGNTGGAVQSNAGNTDGPSTFKLGIVGEDVSVFLRMLDEVSDTTILSRPTLLALNRQPARVLVGRKVGYLNTTSTETATTQTVEFLDTGTQLYVRPFVSADKMIRMELKPQVSEAVIRNITDAGGAAVTIPDEITNELTTNVMVRDGQTIVLGGLFRESTQRTRRQVPFAGDIPIIGAAFRGHEDEVERSEIIFMITPTIVNDEWLIAQGLEAGQFVEAARTGAREGLLPFSRERQSGQLLVEAERLAAAGETQKALNKVQRSLALNRAQPGAVLLRERLMNAPTLWPHRSMLDAIMTDEVKRAADAAPAASQPVAGAQPSATTEPMMSSTNGMTTGSETFDDAAGTEFDDSSTQEAFADEPEEIGMAPSDLDPSGLAPSDLDSAASALTAATATSGSSDQLAAETTSAETAEDASFAFDADATTDESFTTDADGQPRPMTPLQMAKLWNLFQGVASLVPEVDADSPLESGPALTEVSDETPVGEK